MVDLVYLVVIAIGYASGHIVSLYASAVYVDPDELETVFPSTSSSRRAFLRKLADDPRALIQVAEIYKSFWLVIFAVLSVMLVADLADLTGMSQLVLQPVGLAVVWLLYLVLVEALPRRSSRKALNTGMLKHLWIVRTVYVVFYPVVKGYRRILRRSRRTSR